MGAVITRSTVILTIVLIPAVLAVSPFLVMTTGASIESADEVRNLMVELTPVIVLVTWTSAFHGALNAYMVFSVSALSPLLRSAIVVATILTLAPVWGIHAVTAGYAVGEGLRCIASWWFFERRVARLQLTWSMDAEVEQCFSGAAFQTLGSVFGNLVPVASQVMVSPLALAASPSTPMPPGCALSRPFCSPRA